MRRGAANGVSMKKLLMLTAVLVAMALPSLAQQVAPNCTINFGPWTDTNVTPVSFNGTTNCAYWVMSYQVSGFSAISLAFESAVGIQGAPGSFGNFSGTVTSGSNPSTSVSCATVTNCTAVFSGVVSYYRVNFPSHTGSGSIQGTLQGYKTFQGLGGNSPSGSGCPGTSGTPCVVDGVTAAGSAPSTPPVLVAGQDGAPGNIRTLQTDTTGRQIAVGAAAEGAALAGNPVRVCGSDGADCRTLKTDATGDLQTAFIGFGTFNAGQQAVTGTAANLGTNTARAVCVTALAANTIPVYLGPSGVTTSSGLELAPGAGTCQPVNNTNLLYVIATTTGASVSWSLVN